MGATALAGTSNCDLRKFTGLAGISSKIRGDTYDRPEADGGVEPENQYLGPKMMVAEGEVWGASVAAAWQAFRVLEAVMVDAVQTQTLLKWRAAGDTIDLQQLVRLVDAQPPILDSDEQGPFLRYQKTFRADDPNAYSQVSQSVVASAPTAGAGMPFAIIFPLVFGTATGGTVTALNNGNARSWPTITITGPIVNPVVGNQTTGRYLYFDSLSLAAGESLIITTAPNLRAATVGGVSKLGALRFADSIWPSMTRAVTETWQFYALGGGTTGATTMTVAWRDAYSA